MAIAAEMLAVFGYIPDLLAPIDYGKLASLLHGKLQGRVFETAILAAANIFTPGLSPVASPVTFRIYACFNMAGILSITRTVGTVTTTEILNAGNALVAQCAYMFDILVSTGDVINLQYSAAGLCHTLIVVEV